MILDLTRAQARQFIGSPQKVREDIIRPADFPDYPNPFYQPEYDWLFHYERKIAAFLEQWLQPYRYELIGQNGVLCEALSNAFYHGHRKDPHQPIILSVWLGEKGLVIEIADNGPGFDAETVYDGYRNRRNYYSTAGNGIRCMAQCEHFGIFHAARGTIFCLLYLFAPGDLGNLSHHPV